MIISFILGVLHPIVLVILNLIDCCTIENGLIHRIIPAHCKVIALSVFPQITNHSLQMKGKSPV
jgi:hypothetical protein